MGSAHNVACRCSEKLHGNEPIDAVIEDFRRWHIAHHVQQDTTCPGERGQFMPSALEHMTFTVRVEP